MFVNPKAPSSAHGMAYNCIACGDNAITFNDGYHIQHHLNSRTHWSELPLRFMESLEEHAAQAGDYLAAYSVSVKLCRSIELFKVPLWILPCPTHCRGMPACTL